MDERVVAWRVVCDCLFANSSPASVRRTQQAVDIEVRYWPHVTRLADVQLVSPALWNALQNLQLSSRIPADVVQYLQAVYDMNRMRNQAMLAQLDECVRVLNYRGIQPLLLKGAAYLKSGVYADAAARILADLDLMIPTAAEQTAVAELVAIGYTAIEDEDNWRYREHHHLAPVSRPGDYAAVELHRSAVPAAQAALIPTDELWSQAANIESDGLAFKIPAPNHALLLSVIHSEIVDRCYETRLIKLRAIQDSLALEARFGDAVDWSGVTRTLATAGYAHVARAFAYTLAQVAGADAVRRRAAGWRARWHYLLCMCCVRWASLETLVCRLEPLTAGWIRQQHGSHLSSRSVNAYRLREASGLAKRLLRRFRRLSDKDSTAEG